MKFLAIFLTLSAFSARAQSLRSLQDIMSDLGNHFKAISLSLQAGVINSKTITDAENLVILTLESETVIPESVLSLPNIEQASAKNKYESEMKDLEKATIQLSNAIKAGNLDLAKQWLLQIGTLKKQGHKDFK